MALGLKRIETRHWATSYRGPMAIHAAKRWTADERESREMMIELGYFPASHFPPLGAIVAVGNLVDIQRTEMLEPKITRLEEEWGNYGPGRYGWIFTDIVPLADPIPFKGMQGLFDVPATVLRGEAAAAVDPMPAAVTLAALQGLLL
jgi:hypothetical protein